MPLPEDKRAALLGREDVKRFVGKWTDIANSSWCVGYIPKEEIDASPSLVVSDIEERMWIKGASRAIGELNARAECDPPPDLRLTVSGDKDIVRNLRSDEEGGVYCAFPLAREESWWKDQCLGNEAMAELGVSPEEGEEIIDRIRENCVYTS